MVDTHALIIALVGSGISTAVALVIAVASGLVVWSNQHRQQAQPVTIQQPSRERELSHR